MKLKERAKQLKTDIPAVFLAMKHRDTPIIAKVLAAATVAYALSPVDLIPDFIPVLGYLDDLIILPLMVALTIRIIPSAVFEDCREKSAGLWQNGKPKKWYFALPIAAVWLLVLYLVIKAVWF